MKKILVPINFSEVSNNAADYAFELAKRTNAELILFHACYAPVMIHDTWVTLPTKEEIEYEYLELLREKRAQLYHDRGKSVHISCRCTTGEVIREICTYSKDHDIDLIVVGMNTGKSWTERLIGNIAVSLMHAADCPVLAVNRYVRFTDLKRVVFATDYGTASEQTLHPLKELITRFKAKLYVLNVVRELETVTAEQQMNTGFKLDKSFEKLDHAFYDTHYEDIPSGIHHFTTTQQIDMVVMIPRKQSFFETLFNRSATTRESFLTTVPLLALKDIQQ